MNLGFRPKHMVFFSFLFFFLFSRYLFVITWTIETAAVVAAADDDDGSDATAAAADATCIYFALPLQRASSYRW